MESAFNGYVLFSPYLSLGWTRSVYAIVEKLTSKPQQEATAEEKKIWLPAKADEVLFVLKAKRGGMYREWSRMSPEEMAEIEEAARQIFMEEVLSGHYGCTCGHEH